MAVVSGDDLKVAIGLDILRSAGFVRIDFSRRLQSRGSDFWVYANSGYTENERDSDLLVAIIGQLLVDTSAVSKIEVSPFELDVHANRTTTVAAIMEAVVFAARYVGYKVEDVTAYMSACGRDVAAPHPARLGDSDEWIDNASIDAFLC